MLNGKRYILALDEGTTSARAVVFDMQKNAIVAMANTSFELYYPKSGWVEADAKEIWAAQYGSMTKALAKSGVKAHQLVGIGVTNQRETVVVWDKTTGEPVYSAIIWQCRRTAEFCDKLKADEKTARMIFEKTGLIADAYFSASKLKWILDNVDGARRRAENGELCAGTVDSWLVYNLTEGKTHVTDVSNASRTMLFNINELCWDRELLKLFDIPECILPQVIASDEIAGQATVLKEAVSICGILGDQQAALFGHGCYEAGSAKNTYGTGCFILMNLGESVKLSQNKLVTSVAWKIDGKCVYALEGSIFNAGSAVQWLRDGLGFFRTAAESEAFALRACNADGSPGTNGVYIVPAFTGLGAPYWEPDARGVVTGITRNTNQYHIARAVLEAMAYSSKDILVNMERDSGVPLQMLACDGGASQNDFLMQFQSDILGCQLRRPQNIETTVMGAVYMCGLGLKVFDGLEDISDRIKAGKVFSPSLPTERIEMLYSGWKNAVAKTLLEG